MRKNATIKLLFTCLAIALQAGSAYAQNNLDTLTTFYSGAYVPKISNADKISVNPEIIDSTKKIKVSDYGIHSTAITTDFQPEPITPAIIKGEPLTKLYRGLIIAGMGNYTTPYGELWLNKLRSKKSSAGIHIKHLSSTYTQEGYGYAGFNDDEIGIYGKKFLRKHSLLGSVDYERNTVHFYGYDTDTFSLSKARTEQRFNLISANAQLKSHYKDKTQINHDIKLDFYSFSERFESIENNIKLTANAAKRYKKLDLSLNTTVDYYNYKNNSDTVNNTIISINPFWTLNKDSLMNGLSGHIGFTMASDLMDKSATNIYPDLHANLNLLDNTFILIAGANGGVEKNSYKGFTDNNAFVLSSLAMQNSSIYNTYLGLKGNLSATTSYNARVNFTQKTNMALFVNDTNDYENKFDVIYDDATIINIHGEASYQIREKVNVNLSGDYFSYDMKTELRAWYQPQVKIALSANYNLKNKIIAKLDVFYLSNQFEKTFVNDTAAGGGIIAADNELDGLIDINLGVEYRYNKKLGFFIQLNNIANVKYYRWSNYPTQRFSAMGGLSFSF